MNAYLFYTTCISDFSLNNWLTNNGIPNTAKLEQYVAQQLIRELGIDEYLKVPQCDRKTPPYSPSNNQGWNISPGECLELNYLYASHTIALGHIVLLFVCLFVCLFICSFIWSFSHPASLCECNSQVFSLIDFIFSRMIGRETLTFFYIFNIVILCECIVSGHSVLWT